MVGKQASSMAEADLERLIQKIVDRTISKMEASLATAKTDYCTPPALARRLGVSVSKVLHWINTGQLQAINVASAGKSRPRYRIASKDVAIFEARKAGVQSPAPMAPRMRRRRASGDAAPIRFFGGK